MADQDEPRPATSSAEPARRDAIFDGHSRISGEDFLYHLYRGNELLQDNCIAEAKEELERALHLQPEDIEGQGLLGVVYFRLGLYPRAIQIYEDIVRSRPREATPRMNLALCYLKTGQLLACRQMLERLLELVPEHPRAWGYLGLVLQRLGELSKAITAFEHAGQPRMAERVRGLVEQSRHSLAPYGLPQFAADDVGARIPTIPSPSDAAALEPDIDHRGEQEGLSPIPAIRDSQADVPLQPDSASPAGLAVGPGAAAPRRFLSPGAPGIVKRGADCVACRLEAGGLAARASAIRALCAEQAPFKTTPVMRRLRGQDQSETLGAPAQPMVWIEGTGEVMLASRRQHVYVLMVATSPVYIRQTALLGFEGGIHYECGRLAGAPDADGAAVIQLSGTGALVLESDASVSELSVDLEHAPLIRADAVVGWSGRLFSRAIPPEHIGGAHGFVGFEGAGTIYANL